MTFDALYDPSYDWNKFPFRRDAITGRKICQDCWNGDHWGRGYICCIVSRCKCACKEVPAVLASTERSRRRSVTRERNKNQKDQLEASPLKAFNPNFKEKTRSGVV